MAVNIFFCYAHEDEALLNKLKTHLRPLQRQGLIDVWHDRDISAGTDWEQEVKRHLNEAKIILLLVSPDFIDSEYCYGVEMKRALERHERGEACVIPIILRHSDWQEAPFGKLQALPKDGKPVTDPDWYNQDRAFLSITEGIRKVVKEELAKIKSILPEKEQLQPLILPQISLPSKPSNVVNVKLNSIPQQSSVFSPPYSRTIKIPIILTCILVLVGSSFAIHALLTYKTGNTASGSATAQTRLTSIVSSPTSIFSVTKGWRPLLQPFSPLCDDPKGTAWKLIAGSAMCSQSKLSMQQTAVSFAELDLNQVNASPFNLSTFRVQVTITFQDTTNALNLGSLFAQMPATPDGIGDYILEVSPFGWWHLERVKSNKTVFVGTDLVRSGQDNSAQVQVTVVGIVQNGIFSAYIKGYNDDQVLFNQPLNSTPSSKSSLAFGLMVCNYTASQPSTFIYFSDFELDVPA